MKLLVLLAVLFALLPLSAQAAENDEPAIILDAQGFQCLLTTTAVTTADCDMLVMVTYELPKTDWRNALYMEEISCISSDEANFLDLCYTSLIPGIITHSFYDGPQTSALLVGVRTPPRIGVGLSAIYLEAGHGLTFGDTTYETCLEPDVTFFTPATPSCATISWNTVTDVDADGLVWDDAKDVNSTALQEIGSDIEALTPLPSGLLVEAGRITPMGAVFFIEAFSQWVVAAPDAFTIATFPLEPFVVSTGNTALEDDVETESSDSELNTWISSWSVLNNMSLGSATQRLRLVGGAIIGIIAAIIIFFVLSMFRNGVYLAILLAALFIWVGALQNWVEPSLYFLVLTIGAAIGFAKWARDTFA